MKLVVLIGLLQVLACDARLVVASNTVSDDYAYDLSSPVYVALKAQLRRLRAENKPLRLKINSHPCAGKSYFILKHKTGTGRKAPLEASFMRCKLLDFDDYAGANRTGQLLLAFRANAVLLGSAHTEQFDQPDVAYVYVVPRRQRVKLNVKSCVEIKFRTPHAIDAMSSPQLHHTGQEAPVRGPAAEAAPRPGDLEQRYAYPTPARTSPRARVRPRRPAVARVLRLRRGDPVLREGL